MILINDTHEVTISNVASAPGEFKIRNSAKAFSILSSGLYSNKIRAIIRELSTNALDSHIAAKKHDIPFEVHLPTMLEPWFSVKDYGTGLDGDQIENIYTTYFDSSKTGSNDFIGALGLGSKSPFSYTENFTVTSIKHGTKWIYSAFIRADGVPAIVEMVKECTEESNGVEVKFSVTNRSDFESFRSEAQNVFQWFKCKPSITGASFEHKTMKYKEQDIIPGVHIRDDGSMKCVALMGNIAYPLDNIPDATKHFGNLESILHCGLVMEFGIGELDFAASREQLSYIPLTIANIHNKLTLLNSNLEVHIAKQANAIECEWSRAAFLYSKHDTILYSAAVKQYAATTKFQLFTDTDYYGRKTFKFELSELDTQTITIDAFAVRSRKCVNISASGYGSRKYIGIPVSKTVVIVLNDLKTGCVARAKHHYECSSSIEVFCISHKSPDLAVRQIEYDKLLKTMHNPPVVIKASALIAKTRSTPITTTGITTFKSLGGNNGHSRNYTWVHTDLNFDVLKQYYYVALSGHDALSDNKSLDIGYISTLIKQSNIVSLSSVTIFGVRKSRIKEISKLGNWINLEDKIRQEVAKIPSADLASVVLANCSKYNSAYNNQDVIRHVGSESVYAVYATATPSIEYTTRTRNSAIMGLCTLYGRKSEVDSAVMQYTALKDSVHSRYPLLEYCYGAPYEQIARYVNLVDAT